MSDSPDAYDLVVIGSGPAGEKGAAQAAYFGKSVAVVEQAPEPGGAGVHTGTLPSKTLRETALYVSGYRARELYGVAVELDRGARLSRLMSRKSAIADSESRRIRDNFERHRVTYISGRGRVAGPNEVEVEGAGGVRRLSASYVLIATGSRPHRPSDIEFSHGHIHDSDEILKIAKLPESLVILGGGVIGCEYACMFAALGCSVTLVDARDALLPFLDAEIVQGLSDSMARLGVVLRTGVRWSGVEGKAGAVSLSLSDGTRLECEQLLYAAGRIGNSEGIGLREAGVVVDSRGYVKVDECYRTSVPSILAAGDVVGFPALASVSMEQGRVAICHAFGLTYKRAVASVMPYGIYTIPEVSTVGETERSALDKGFDAVCGRAAYRDNARGKIAGDAEGMVKLVVDAKTRRLLGVHVIGERATELVHIGQTVVHLQGTVDLFIDMVFNFPTLAEAYKYAAYDCLGALGRRNL